MTETESADQKEEAPKLNNPAGVAERWIKEIQLYEKDAEKFCENGSKIIKRYRGKSAIDTSLYKEDTRFNILWSNTQTALPALYSRTPKPVVERRKKDADQTGRIAAEILERCLDYTFSCIQFDSVITKNILDYLLPGRGQLWVRYAPIFQKTKDGEEDLGHEEVKLDYIYWQDFGHTVARVWEDVRAVWKRVFLNKEQAKEIFGEKIAGELKFASVRQGLDGEDASGETKDYFKRVAVYEVWDKDSRAVYWINKEYKNGPLKVQQDPLKLRHFFPCPRPLYATLTSESLIPTADFMIYRRLADDLEVVARRIGLLQEAIQAKGMCDPASYMELRDLFDSEELIIQPVKNYMQIKQAGGVKDLIEWAPIDVMADVLNRLYEAESRLKNDIYEITGWSDIVRGVTDPNETAAAQKIKGSFATSRLDYRRKQVQLFCRDTTEIVGEIIAEHFSPETIYAMAGVDSLPQEYQENFDAAYQLLKTDLDRNYRIDIETDSTIALDEQEEKQSVNEYITSVGDFLQKSSVAFQLMPELKPVAIEMVKLGIRRQKAGRVLEGMLDTALQSVLDAEEAAKQNPPETPPDPAIMKIESEERIAQAKIANDAEKAQLKAQMNQIVNDAKNQVEAYKAQMELEKTRLEMDYTAQIEQLKLENKMAIESAKLQQQAYEMDVQARQNQIQMLTTSSEKEAEEEKPELPPVINVTANVIAPTRRVGEIDTDPETGKRKFVIVDAPLE